MEVKVSIPFFFNFPSFITPSFIPSYYSEGAKINEFSQNKLRKLTEEIKGGEQKHQVKFEFHGIEQKGIELMRSGWNVLGDAIFGDAHR